MRLTNQISAANENLKTRAPSQDSPANTREGLGVYRAINQIAASMASAGVAKAHVNRRKGYHYRSVDDLLDRLAPLLAKHRLLVLPRVLRRHEFERSMNCDAKTPGVSVNLHVAFDLISARDGSRHTVETFGEAWDDEDKATAKAQTAAYKMAMFQTFCIPVAQIEPDAGEYFNPSGAPEGPSSAQNEPSEGWSRWSLRFIAMVKAANDMDDLSELLEASVERLGSVARTRPDIYLEISAACRAVEIAVSQVESDVGCTARFRRPNASSLESGKTEIAERLL